MAFLAPVYTDEPFGAFTNDDGTEDVFVPLNDAAQGIGDGWTQYETILGKWWYRLSADGYLDATNWSGPYDSLDDAKAACRDEYDIDPDTGDDLPEVGKAPHAFPRPVVAEG